MMNSRMAIGVASICSDGQKSKEYRIVCYPGVLIPVRVQHTHPPIEVGSSEEVDR